MKKTILFFLIVLWIGQVHAQGPVPEILSTAGETHQGTSMKIDWTLGEVAISTIQNSNRQITQGFHQPNYTITSIEELAKELGEIKVYPTPAIDRITMELDFKQNRKVKIRLLDLNGKIIWTKAIKGSQLREVTEIGNLPNGNYFLHFLIDENQYHQTFKIQKIK